MSTHKYLQALKRNHAIRNLRCEFDVSTILNHRIIEWIWCLLLLIIFILCIFNKRNFNSVFIIDLLKILSFVQE